MFTTIFIFFIVIIVLVMVHEFGHFAAAKISKMRVDEFAFGFPPRLFGKKIGETTYAFNALPIGGYVKIAGENFDEKSDSEGNMDPRLFTNRPRYMQVFVLAAGVIMNFLLAFVLLTYINSGERFVTYMDTDFVKYQKENPNESKLRVLYVAENSPAKAAGLSAYDEILSISNGSTTIIPKNATSVILYVYENQNSPLTINFQKYDTGEKVSSTVSAVYGILDDKKSIGLATGESLFLQNTLRGAISSGFTDTLRYIKLTVFGLGDIVVKLVNKESVGDNIAGPIGIARMVGEASEEGLKPLLFFVAVISINLGVFNLLPLPALDGGRILFVLWEMLTRKRMNIKFQTGANLIGFSLLIILMIVVTYFDVSR